MSQKSFEDEMRDIKAGRIPENAIRSIHQFCNDYQVYPFYSHKRLETLVGAIKANGKKIEQAFNDLNKTFDDITAFAHSPDCKKKDQMTDPHQTYDDGDEECGCTKGKPLHWLRAFAGYYTYLDNECYPDDVRDVLASFVRIVRGSSLKKEYETDGEDHQFLRLIYDLFSGVQGVNYAAEEVLLLDRFIESYIKRISKLESSKVPVYKEALRVFSRYNKTLWGIREIFITIAKSINIDAEEWYVRF